jgi:hypothetical protein
MNVSHFGGILKCKTIEDLELILNIRDGTGVNEFWIVGKENNPCLTILVNNNYANLTYFPKDGHPGFQSVGMSTCLNPDETTVFYTNTSDEEIKINDDTIVPFDIALKAAKEFFASSVMPTCLE